MSTQTIPTLAVNSENSLQTQFFKRPEGSLAYTDYGGSGEYVVMFPGMGALRSEYRYLAPKLLEAGYHPVSVDLRGHGESSVPWQPYDVPSVGRDILAMLDYLDAGPVHLICTSKSAGSGVWAAAEHPNSLRSLVLIGAFARQVKVNPVMNILFWLMMHNPWRVQAWVWYYGTIYPTRKPADFSDYLQQLKCNLEEPGRFQAANDYGNASLQTAQDRLSKVKAPNLVIMGTKDPDFPDPAAEGKYIVKRTGGKLELIEGAGHYPQTEMPQETIPVIIDFLNQAAR
jgi:pimeloyl-ACP methyl ester carboxylesterase